MTETAQKICIDALSLPRKARADLAHRLLVSLEDDVASADLEDAWKQTAESRYAELKKGTTTARDMKKAVNDARSKLAN